MKEQRDQLSRRGDHNLPLVPPWDDPADDVWEDVIVEIPEEYDGYVTRLQLGLCGTSITGEEIEENR